MPFIPYLLVWSVFPALAFAFKQYSLQYFDLIVGDVQLRKKSESFPSLDIKLKDGRKTVWKSAMTQPWIILADAKQNRPPIQDGNYQVSYELKKLTDSLTVETVDISGDAFCLVLKGSLLDCSAEVNSCQTLAKYEFTIAEGKSGRDISFSGKVFPTLTLNEVHTVISFASHKEESFHGFGESFTHFDLTGRKVPVIVSEQGVGRDEQPITDYLNKFVAEGVGGHWYTTYAPKPVFLTNYNRSFSLSTSETSFFDLTRTRDEETVEVDVWADSFAGKIMTANSMIDLVSTVSEFTGKQSVLPRWTQEGAVVGLEGGTDSVTRIVDNLLAGGVPVAGVWLQDWVGLRHSWDGDRLIWNWEVNYDHYPQWQEMVSKWRQRGIRVLTYLNPFFSDPASFVDTTELRNNFYQEGLEKGYFVKKADGSPYLMNSLSIEFATLDLTNPNARDWMKSIIINQTLVEAQSSGWMCDFGEYLPFDAVMFDGRSGAEYHNFYPQAWAELTAEALEEYRKQQGRDAEDNDIIYFMRSAWTFSPPSVPVFWLGDQLMSWDGNDGIKTVIKGALSSGLTGHLITHSDIGGYTAEIYNVSQLTYIRSSELLQRWSELSAFGFGLFRTHIGSSTSPDIAQVYDSAENIAHFARFAAIYASLADYRLELMAEAAQRGLPLIRPLLFYYGYDAATWKVDNQYLVGTDLLVAPCLDEGQNRTLVYFPAGSGRWRSIWKEDLVVEAAAGEAGVSLEVDSPIGFPPVFFREGSKAGERLRVMIRSRDWSLP